MATLSASDTLTLDHPITDYNAIVVYSSRLGVLEVFPVALYQRNSAFAETTKTYMGNEDYTESVKIKFTTASTVAVTLYLKGLSSDTIQFFAIA